MDLFPFTFALPFQKRKMTIPFIDIHTHKVKSENTISIRNFIPNIESESVEIVKDYHSVGMHPWYLQNTPSILSSMDSLEKWIANEKCLAIGEAGLDKVCETSWELQESTFLMQAKLAQKHNKPMIIHCVKAHNEILKMRNDLNAGNVWIFHGFNSSLEMGRQILASGCLLSFGDIILRPGSRAAKILTHLEPDQFFLETDNDQKIEIEVVYHKAAEIRNTDVTKLKEEQLKNFSLVFNKGWE